MKMQRVILFSDEYECSNVVKKPLEKITKPLKREAWGADMKTNKQTKRKIKSPPDLFHTHFLKAEVVKGIL